MNFPDQNFNPGGGGRIVSFSDIFDNDSPGDVKPTVVNSTADLTDDAKDDVLLDTTSTPVDKPDVTATIVDKPADTTIPAAILDTPSPVTNQYKEFYKKMVALGEWEPLETITLDDETKVPIDEAEITEEMFDALATYQAGLKKEALLSDTVELKGVSEFTKKLIEIEKNGGNVTQALEAFQNIKEPLATIDVTTKEGQKAAIYMLNSNKGLSDKTIETLIKGYEAEGSLEVEGEKAFQEVEGAYNKYLDDLNAQALAAKDNRKKAIQTYKKELKEQITSTFKVNETVVNKLITAATKADEKGGYEMDAVYNNMRKDPKQAGELLFFLLNKEEYLNQKFSEMKAQLTAKVAKDFRFIKGVAGSSSITRPKDHQDEDIQLIIK